MKRNSQRIVVKKVAQKRYITSLVMKDPLIKLSIKGQKGLAHTFVYDIVDDICRNILSSAQQIIQLKQEQNKYKRLINKIQIVDNMIQNMIQPKIEKDQSLLIMEEQPKTIKLDRLCIIQNTIERKIGQKKTESVHVSPNQTLTDLFSKQNHKYGINVNKHKNSANNLKYIGSVLHTSQLVALPFVESQKDLRLNHIHAFYRQKFIKQEQISRQQLKNIKRESIRQFRKTNRSQIEQFNFDYNGDKIPISSGIPLKENSIKLLKTICKVPKDKYEVKHANKIQEYCRSSKLGQLANSIKKLQSVTNIKQLKDKIEKVTWNGKLESLKNMPQIQISI